MDTTPQPQDESGEYTPTEVAAFIGYRYGEGRNEFNGARLVDEFGLLQQSVRDMFAAIAELPGISVNIAVGGSHSPSIYTISGRPVSARDCKGNALDTRAGAFLLGWMLADHSWFTLSDAVDATGWEREATKHVVEIRLRYLPIWTKVHRRGAKSETLYVSIAE